MSGFAVVLHDVHPGEAAVLDEIMRALRPRVGKTFTLAVVPRWHGHDQSAAWSRVAARWCERASDLTLHGFTHRASRPGLVALLTRNANEFAHTTLHETRLAIERGQSFCRRTFGRTLPGLVPPAWALPHELGALRGLDVEYIARFSRLETARGARLVRTHSWDWGILPGIARVGAFAGKTITRGDVRVLAIHPEDVRRGLLPSITALIDRLLRRGDRAMTLTDAALST